MLPLCGGRDAGRETVSARQSPAPQSWKAEMQKYECTVCGWVYDPEKGDPEGDIKPGTPFEDLPPDYECPVCGAGKDAFKPVD